MAEPTVSNSVGTVQTAINGVTATDRNGEVRELSANSPVFKGDIIKTAGDAMVAVQLNNGSRFDLGRNSEAVLDSDVLGQDAEEARAEAVMEAAAIQDDLLAALEGGSEEDILNAINNGEATAAGGQPNAGGSDAEDSADSPVVIDLTGLIGDVFAGHFTTTKQYPFQYDAADENVLPPGDSEPDVGIVQIIVPPVSDSPKYVPPAFPGGSDGQPVVSGNKVTIIEGTSDQSKVVEFVMKLSAPYDQDVTVTYQLKAGTAEFGENADWFDVSLEPQTVVIPAGSTEIKVPVNIVQDRVDEANDSETFTIELLSANNANINTAFATATVVIYDDDTTPVAVNDNGFVNAADVDFDAENLEVSISGNVLTNDTDQDGDSTAGNLQVVNPVSLSNDYGQLTINTDGTYSFLLNQAGVEKLQSLAGNEKFSITIENAYQVTDGVNPGNTANLVIDLYGDNLPPAIEVDDDNNPETKPENLHVDEAGLPAGTDAKSNSELADGYIKVSDPDGLGDITSLTFTPEGGAALTLAIGNDGINSLADMVGQTFNTENGTVTLTAYDNNGTFTYEFELTSPTTDVEGVTETNSFDVTVSDGLAEATATVTVEIVDDVPVIAVNVEAIVPILTVDESDIVDAAGTGSAPKDFTALFASVAGADGEKSVTYALSAIDATDSGLNDTQSGESIYLYMDGNDVVGRVGSNDAANESGVIAFRISESSGSVSLTQYSAVVHADSTDPDEADAPATLVGENLITLSATITDNDGDTATSAMAADITSAFAFEDDGPSVTDMTASTAGAVMTDETDSLGQAVTGTASVFTGGVVDLGEDGGSSTVTLRIDNATSGLSTVDGDAITLVADATDASIVYGKYDDTGTQDATAFTISIGSDGKLTVTQSVALDHPDAADPDDAVNLTGKLSAVVTATDGDDDVASKSVAIGDQISFEDDGPSVTSVESIEVANVVASTSGDITGLDFGADGMSGFEITSWTDLDGITETWDADTLTLTASIDGTSDDLYTLTLDVDGNGDPTGTYTFELLTPQAITYTPIDFSLISAQGPQDTIAVPTGDYTVTFDGKVWDGTNLVDVQGNDEINPNNIGFGIDNGNVDNHEGFTAAVTDINGDPVEANGIQFTVIGQAGGVNETQLFWTAKDANGNEVDSGEMHLTGLKSINPVQTIDVNSDTPFSSIEVYFDHGDGNDAIRIQDFSLIQEIVPPDMSLDFTLTATDGDGDAVTATFNVSVDSQPVAVDDNAYVVEGGVVSATTDVVLMLDTSGSMQGDNIAALKGAVQSLFESGSVHSVFIVDFNSSATLSDSGVNGGWYTNLDDAWDAVNALSTGGKTDYDAALSTVMTEFAPPPSGGDRLVSMFISDGEPTDDNGTGSDGIVLAEEASWIQFLNDENFDGSYAIGFDGITSSNEDNLEPIAWTPGEVNTDISASSSDDHVLILTDPADLVDVIISTIVVPSYTVSGNLMDNDDIGSDIPGSLVSITYDFNGNGSDETHTFANDGASITFDVRDANGVIGEVTINNDGSYSYAATDGLDVADARTASITYTIQDNDGDTSSAVLNVGIDDASDVYAADNIGIATIASSPITTQTVTLYSNGDEDDWSDSGDVELDRKGDSDKYLRIKDDDGSSGNGGTATSPVFDVNTDGSTLSFNTWVDSDEDGSGDTASWKLQVLSGSSWTDVSGANNSGDIRSGNVNNSTAKDSNSLFTTDSLAAGSYRFVFTIEDDSSNGDDFRIYVDDVKLTSSVGGVSVTAVSGNVITDPDLDVASLELAIDDEGSEGATLQYWNGSAYVDVVDGTVITGTYGSLELNEDGSYTYVPDADLANIGEQDVFDYQLVQADGDYDAAQLTVMIGDGSTSLANAIQLDADNLNSNGTTGNDVIIGDDNDNIIFGDAGDDHLEGGAGNDVLGGQNGTDVLIGGAGSDEFVFDPGDSAVDVVADYNINEGDVLNLADMLGGFDNQNDDISDFVHLIDDGAGNVTVQVDSSGQAGAGGWTDVATLNGLTDADRVSIKVDDQDTTVLL